MRPFLTVQLVTASAFALTVTGCTQSPAVSQEDIAIACKPTSQIAKAEDSAPTFMVNAESATARKLAAQRIATIDQRYEPLAEALTIIAESADIVALYSGNPPAGEIDWDLIKLAQAAAADQCELLFAQQPDQ